MKRKLHAATFLYICFAAVCAFTATRPGTPSVADNQDARHVVVQADGSAETLAGMVQRAGAISKTARITIYTTPACFGCKQLEREIPTLIATGTPVEIINAKDSPPEDKTIDQFPTIIIYDGDVEIKRIVGYTPAADILAFLPQEVEDPDYRIYKH